MALVFPIPFGGDAPAISILDGSGNILDDTLDENTYATFGTIPKGGSSTLTLYVKNTGATPIYSIKCEGLASSNQLGEAANTYEALDLPQELGGIDPRETIELEVVWTVPTESPTGMKVFGLKVTDSTYLEVAETNDYFTKITITNNDTDLLLDFPIEIDFDAASITWANTTSDGRDLRFYDENLNELQFYIETWTPATTTGKVWVRVPKIEGGESIDIYCGYGKFDLPQASDEYAKYEFNEEFDGGFNEDWQLTGSLTYTFVADYIDLGTGGATGTGLFAELPSGVGTGYIYEFKVSRMGNMNSRTNFYVRLWGETDATRAYTTLVTAGYDTFNILSQAYGNVNGSYTAKLIIYPGSVEAYTPEDTLRAAFTVKSFPSRVQITQVSEIDYANYVHYFRVYKTVRTAPTIAFADVADITAEFTNPDVDSGIICVIGNVVRQLAFHDYDFKKIIYEVGYNNAYWRVPGTSGGIYVWGKLEMRPLYGEDVSFVDNLYANDAYFYTFTDYQYDIHDKLDVEGVLYDIQAIQVHDAGRETIYKTLILKRQPEYYACCVGVVS